jgi:hypothetical protein
LPPDIPPEHLMPLPDHVSALIDRLIEECLRNSAGSAAETVRANRALPVYADAGGSLFLKPNGEVWFQGNESVNAALKLEESPHWCLVARLAAAERFPELAALVPIRPAGAADCSDCEGSGSVLNGLVRCGVCYGLGWSEVRSNPPPEPNR